MAQTTLARSVVFKGIGLHSGLPAEVRIHPALAGSGFVFLCHSEHGTEQIRLSPHCVQSTILATEISQGGCKVKTVEHLLAALAGFGLDNALIETSGGEVPILDGSALPFVEQFMAVGIILQSSERRGLRIIRPIECYDGEKMVAAKPYDGFKVDYSIDFAHPLIGYQQLILDVSPETFLQVAKARTFGFSKDIQTMMQNGLALGGSLSNAVLLTEQGVLNPEGMRSPDEFVRHKLLDFIGDMAVMGQPLLGSFTVRYSGHKLNNLFLRQLCEQADSHLEPVQLPKIQHPFLAIEKVKTRVSSIA